MKALIIMTNGFEDVEGLATVDVLKRSGIEVVCCGLDQKNIITQSGHHLSLNILLNEVDINNYDFLIIPGGRAVKETLDKDKRIDDLIDKFLSQNKMICSICAAPLLIGKRGYFKNHQYTCFPGCDESIKEGINTHEGVVVSLPFITAKSMYYSIDFALQIIEIVQGKAQRDKIYKQIRGEI